MLSVIADACIAENNRLRGKPRLRLIFPNGYESQNGNTPRKRKRRHPTMRQIFFDPFVNSIINLVPSCSTCNLAKNNKNRSLKESRTMEVEENRKEPLRKRRRPMVQDPKDMGSTEN